MNKFKLASLLSIVNPTKEEQFEIKRYTEQLFLDEYLQQDFYEYTEKWKLAPWIKTQFERNNSFHRLSDTCQKKFMASYEKVETQNQARNKCASKILHKFKEKGIEVIILKGNCFALTIYQEVAYKRMNDFDILIHKKDWDQIQTIYLEEGYIPLGFGWAGEKEEPAKFSHVGMSFISPDFSCIIGSQWGLKSPTTSYKDLIHEAWNTSLPFDFIGIEVKQLSPEFNFLHLILHLGVYKCGIRDCMDIYNLVRSKQLNEKYLVDLLIESKAVEKAIFSIEMASFSSPNFADNISDQLSYSKNHFLIRRMQKRKKLHELTGDFQDVYSDYFQDIEKQVIYFNIFPEFHKKMIFYFKILTLIFLPKNEIILKLNDLNPREDYSLLWFKIPKTTKRIFELISQEIGWKFTFLLFLKLGIDTLFSVKNYFIKKRSYFDYLKAKNINPTDIEKVVKNIQ